MSNTERIKRYLQKQREREFNRLHPKDQRRLIRAGRAINKRTSPITKRARGMVERGAPKGREIVRKRARGAARELLGSLPGDANKRRKKK